MTTLKIKTRVVHRVPTDFKQQLDLHLEALKTWNRLTPVARDC